MAYTRVLKYQFPLVRGEDVIELQQRLEALGFSELGQVDGIYGVQTDSAVRRYQQQNGLDVDGIVGMYTWQRLFEQRGSGGKGKLEQVLDELAREHTYRDSVRWYLSNAGLHIDGAAPQGTGGQPLTVRRVWSQFGPAIDKVSKMLEVPAELIVATICTESGGNPEATREEPGYISDQRTPDRVSVGLTQTLISTARAAVGDPAVDRAWLREPENAIHAGAAYIAQQWDKSHFDPPKVACAYNAGGIYYQEGEENRWKMRQYPIGSGHHADRFVQWFNDAIVVFKELPTPPSVSFTKALMGA